MKGGPYIHYCGEPGCAEWGGFGQRGAGGVMQWRCRAHVWPDFFETGKIQTDSPASADETPARMPPSQPRLL